MGAKGRFLSSFFARRSIGHSYKTTFLSPWIYELNYDVGRLRIRKGERVDGYWREAVLNHGCIHVGLLTVRNVFWGTVFVHLNLLSSYGRCPAVRIILFLCSTSPTLTFQCIQSHTQLLYDLHSLGQRSKLELDKIVGCGV